MKHHITLHNDIQEVPQLAAFIDEVAEACGIDILMRGGWYCASTLDFKLLRSHPEAVRVLSEMKFIRGCRVPIGKQRYTRFICRLLRRRQDVPYGG
jgi:hypothetical protein